MAKMTLTQKRNLLKGISSKGMKAFTNGLMNMGDAEKIKQIAERNLRKLK